MPRKRITGKRVKTAYYTDEELREYLADHLDNDAFRLHCEQTAEDLKIGVDLVKDILTEKAFKILKLTQEKAFNNVKIKIRILGFFSIQTRKRSLDKEYVKLKIE